MSGVRAARASRRMHVRTFAGTRPAARLVQSPSGASRYGDFWRMNNRWYTAARFAPLSRVPWFSLAARGRGREPSGSESTSEKDPPAAANEKGPLAASRAHLHRPELSAPHFVGSFSRTTRERRASPPCRPFGCRPSAFQVSHEWEPLLECSPACRGAPRGARLGERAAAARLPRKAGRP